MKTPGGPRRGQGRKPLDFTAPSVTWTVRVTRYQRAKVNRLGGAGWVRDKIDETKEPEK